MRRKYGESQEAYRARRRTAQYRLKVYLGGRILWASSSKGTYHRGDEDK